MMKAMSPKAPKGGKGMMKAMSPKSPKGGKGMMSPKMMSPKMMMMKMKGPAPAMAPFHLRILHMNDHHSHLFAEDFDFEVTEDMPASLANFAEIELSTGGMPMTVAAMEHFLEDGYASGKDDVYKLHAGDAITGTLFFTLYQGLADADMMKSICFDAMTPGNHEFDNGDTGFATFMDALESGESCPYTPILSANIAPGVDSPINGRLVSYLTYEYETGHKVGMIGITDQRSTMESSRPDPTTDVMDEVESTVAMIAELMADDVDIIILITHVGLGFDLSTMSAIPGVDVVVGGHSHTFMGDTPPVSAADPVYAYPGKNLHRMRNLCYNVALSVSHILLLSLQKPWSRKTTPRLVSSMLSSIPPSWVSSILNSTATAMLLAAPEPLLSPLTFPPPPVMVTCSQTKQWLI